ncbi:MAG: 50S ribosomal protein L25/general stress protein Ctc [Burkholderiaceae bacterium]|jgi:large subunit ribosomal protein L25|nr:50S ribosomal protein L25/general stress protein Ctc [Burkholderiaceae bacterium]
MKFAAFERNMQGTGASRRLRNAGKVPGIVYGSEGAPQLIELDHNALWHAIKKEAFHSSVLDMELAGQISQVLLRDVQMHPYRPQVLHVDFQRVSAKQKIHMKIRLHYSGEDESPAVKLDKCLINHIVSELEVSCLPADLPEAIHIDLSKLEKGATLTLKDIQLPQGVEAVLHGHAAEEMVLASVVMPAAEEATTADADTAAAPAAAAAPAPDKKTAAAPEKKPPEKK